MDVHKWSLLSVFDAKQRLEVPLYQRQYVWSQELQWQSLWEDIEHKFVEALVGRKDAPNHFLGAMVLDQKQTPTGHVIVRQVIDGQQRLTTFQIFLAAYRDFCKMQGCDALAGECDKFIFNTGMMSDPEIDKYKVWPTQLDRPQFMDVVDSGSREELLKRHPLRKRPRAHKFEPRPLMVEAYFFFFDQLEQFFLGQDGEPPFAHEHPVAVRADECFQTLRNALMVVVIDLQVDDDPQVIFETLNARGAPLLPADLLRNYIFFRANRGKLDIDAAYKKYWARFDEEFWREEVKQGRLVRPRSDLFMQHFLACRQGQDIPIKHLYIEYKSWIETAKPFTDITEELATLSRQGDHFRRIIAPKPDDVIYGICTFLDAYDIRTAYPLLLTLLNADLDKTSWDEISKILESYLLRRAICNLNTKNYNRIFLSLSSRLQKDGISAARLKELLHAQTGDSGLWPDDTKFHEAWRYKASYHTLNNPKLVHLFGRLNQTFMSSKSENLSFIEQPTIEHIMPQGWIEHWPLPDGSKGLDLSNLLDKDVDSDPRAEPTRTRNDSVQSLGNLTLLSLGLNSSQSNSSWEKKRPEMAIHSLLPINQDVLSLSEWTEASIDRRSEALFERAISIWQR